MREPPHRPKVTIRLPEDLHRRMTDLAKAEHRTLNNLIILILDEYMSRLDRPDKGKS